MEASDLLTEPGGHGLRLVKIPRYQNGFGFTLRHFIVYPPELYVNDPSESHVQQKRNRRRVVKVTEPVDTIFVKSVVENGPADCGGLCVGDRIVSVNGWTIFGKSYDQVVRLIQKTAETLRLEVSPKQYDTLQLFFEESHRPETNQRPSNTVTPDISTKVSPRDNAGFSHRYYHNSPGELYPNDHTQRSSNGSSESFFLNPSWNQSSMSSPYPNSNHSNPQIFSHLPRPTPYKSSSVWNSGLPQQQRGLTQVPNNGNRHQPQLYYPFNHDLQSLPSGPPPLWKIKEEPTAGSGAKSAESILAGNEIGQGEYGEYYETAQRSGSMECLTGGVASSGQNVPTGSVNWSNMGPGYRYSVAADGNSINRSSQRRESTGSIPSSSAMVVTMSSTNSKIQSPDHHNFGDYSSDMGSSNPYNCSNVEASSGQGYENKIVDRIRRSCEQKEEFLKRPNQPLAWTPLQSASMAFPKELYAQPQKFEKIPWPPKAHILPTVTTAKPQLQNISTASSPNSSFDGQVKSLNNVSVVNVHHYPESNQSPSRTLSPSSVNVQNYESDRSANLRSQVQNTSSTSQYDSRSISPSWFEYGPRNRTMIIGSRKLHCDPPPDWKPDLASLTYHPTTVEEESLTTSLQSETDIDVQTPEGPVQMLLSASADSPRDSDGRLSIANWSSIQRPNYLSLPGSVLNNCQSRQRQFSAFPSVANPQRFWSKHDLIEPDTVKLRKRELDLDPENDRLVRRVSYLKATSSPIDMDRKGCSPTSPTRSIDILSKSTTPVPVGGRRRSVANKLSAEFFPKGRIIRLKQYFEDRTQQPSIFKFNVDSPTSEFRGFGSFNADRSPDSSEINREGQLHFKIRVGENKKGGYSRPWRHGWAQIRKSGCLYISKDRLSRESVMITEDSVIIALSLRSGVTVEQAEDYSKRKHVLRIKTSYTSDDIASLSIEGSVANANAHQPSHSTAVEILLQSEDTNDLVLWLQCLHTQLENNNYCNGSTSSFKGIFFGSEFSLKQKSLLTSFLPSPAIQGQHQPSSDKNVASINNNSLVVSSVAGNNAASPKTKTWKGKVARQWKKVHNIIDTSGDSKVLSPYNSIPPVGATFGINLENCPPGEINPFVPRVIEYAVDVVEKRGIDMVGLYRIPGNNASVAFLTDRLNKGEDPNPDKDPKWLDVHVVASLIKSFLRRLPDPLLTDDRYQAFIVAADEPDPEKCLEKMQYLITDLPDHNYETLRVVVMHLKNVAEHGESNRMDARNLAIVFGPTIVRTAEENVTSMVQDMKNQCKIVEMLVVNADELFKERRVKSELVSPLSSEVSGAVISQPNPLSGVNVQVYDSNTPASVSSNVRAQLSPVATIQNEIRTSVLQAAMRKASQKSRSKAAQNVYGLPSKPPEKTKPVDDAGFIRSYAGLNEETEQRVRNFELETRAMLSREDRSPHSSANNVGPSGISNKPVKGMDDLRIHRLKLDDELQRAKDDLENDDFYDKLADNPSNIVHHRESGLPMFPVGSGTRNLSSSSISSSNSNSTVPSLPAPLGVYKLGPVPFKSAFVPQYLPPKPPQLHSSGSSITGPTSIQSKSSFSSTSSPVSPIRRVSSMDRLGTIDFDSARLSTLNSKDSGRSTLLERKLGPLPFVPKHFGGSLDSLKDIANGNNNDGVGPSGDGRNGTLGTLGGGGQIGSREDCSPRSSEGSDLVTSLSRTLDKKLNNLRRSQENAGNAFSSLSSSNNLDSQDEHEEEEPEVFQFQVDPSKTSVVSPTQKTTSGEDVDLIPATNEISKEASKQSCVSRGISTNGLVKKRDKRRNSMIERRFDSPHNGSTDIDNGTVANTGYYRNPSLHRFSGDAWSNIPNGLGQSLTKDAKTATNRLTRDCRRRHSLSGAGDILHLAFGDKKYIHDIKVIGQDPSKSHSNDALTSAALTTAGILESHV